eukprot:PhF_6_TR10017/c1_g1_i1/m.15330
MTFKLLNPRLPKTRPTKNCNDASRIPTRSRFSLNPSLLNHASLTQFQSVNWLRKFTGNVTCASWKASRTNGCASAHPKKVGSFLSALVAASGRNNNCASP